MHPTGCYRLRLSGRYTMCGSCSGVAAEFRLSFRFQFRLGAKEGTKEAGSNSHGTERRESDPGAGGSRAMLWPVSLGRGQTLVAWGAAGRGAAAAPGGVALLSRTAGPTHYRRRITQTIVA